MSLPSRERELKQAFMAGIAIFTVAPFAGARVETERFDLPYEAVLRSLPSRERELKQPFGIFYRQY